MNNSWTLDKQVKIQRRSRVSTIAWDGDLFAREACLETALDGWHMGRSILIGHSWQEAEKNHLRKYLWRPRTASWCRACRTWDWARQLGTSQTSRTLLHDVHTNHNHWLDRAS